MIRRLGLAQTGFCNGALARGDRAVIADPDGSFVQRFYEPCRGDVILNPFDERAARLDLFAEIVQPHEVVTVRGNGPTRFRPNGTTGWSRFSSLSDVSFARRRAPGAGRR